MCLNLYENAYNTNMHGSFSMFFQHNLSGLFEWIRLPAPKTKCRPRPSNRTSASTVWYLFTNTPHRKRAIYQHPIHLPKNNLNVNRYVTVSLSTFPPPVALRIARIAHLHRSTHTLKHTNAAVWNRFLTCAQSMTTTPPIIRVHVVRIHGIRNAHTWSRSLAT